MVGPSSVWQGKLSRLPSVLIGIKVYTVTWKNIPNTYWEDPLPVLIGLKVYCDKDFDVSCKFFMITWYGDQKYTNSSVVYASVA